MSKEEELRKQAGIINGVHYNCGCGKMNGTREIDAIAHVFMTGHTVYATGEIRRDPNFVPPQETPR